MSEEIEDTSEGAGGGVGRCGGRFENGGAGGGGGIAGVGDTLAEKARQRSCGKGGAKTRMKGQLADNLFDVMRDASHTFPTSQVQVSN